MNFGMFTDFHIRDDRTQADAFEESFRQVEAAEQMGMDAVWLAEHHFSPDRSVLASPIVIASAIAARTSHIRIGLAVQVLPLTNPLRVAEEAATVDHISKGRFDFGIGRSGLTKYYQGYNVPYEESRERFREALTVIRKAWDQETFSHEGSYHSFANVTVVPRPYQQPHPPVHVAVSSPDTFEMVGRMGYSIFISANTPIPQLQERLDLYRQARKEAGHTGTAEIAIRLPIYVADTEEKARAEPEASMWHEIRYGARQLSASAATAEIAERLQRVANSSYDDLLKQRVLFGTPEAVVDRLQQYQEELGVTGVVAEVNYGGQISYDRVLHSIRLLTDKVVPKFK